MPLAAAPVGPTDLPPLLSTRSLNTPARLTLFLDRFDQGWRSLQQQQYTCELIIPQSDTCDASHWSQTLTDYLATPDYVDLFWRRRGKTKDPALELRLARGWPAVLEAALRNDAYVRQAWEPLQDSLAAFHPEVGGIIVTRDQARDIMRHDEDRARRRAAFESGAALSQRVSTDLLELFRRRNLFAQRFGYKDFADMSLAQSGLSATQMDALEDTLEDLTNAPYRDLLVRIQANLGVFQLHGWDLLYGQQLLQAPQDSAIPRDEAQARVLVCAKSLGLKPETLPIHLAMLGQLPYSARMVPADPPNRIVVMFNPEDGLDGQVSLFHEFGRALLEANLPDPRPTTRNVPEVWRDAMGDLFSAFAVERSWLLSGHGFPEDRVDMYRRSWVDSRLLSLRGALMISRFERTLYRQPGTRPDSLWRVCTERYLQVEAPEVSLWGSVVPLLDRPLLYCRYVASAAASAQVLETMRTRFGKADGTGAGMFLNEDVMKPSATLGWPEVLRRATGSPLHGAPLARELSRP